MLLDPLPLLVSDPGIPMHLENSLCVFAPGHIVIALSLLHRVHKRLLGDPPLQDKPRSEIHTSLLAVAKDAVGSEGWSRWSGREGGRRQVGGGLGGWCVDPVGEFAQQTHGEEWASITRSGNELRRYGVDQVQLIAYFESATMHNAVYVRCCAKRC